jgi:hypothetical protein
MKTNNKQQQPIRLSAWRASEMLGVTINKVSRGLKVNGIVAGTDGKYSLKDIVTAMSARTPLEAKAKEAKLQSIIDEAVAFGVESRARRAKLAPASMLEEYATMLLERLLYIIRTSSMPELEKKQLIDQVSESKLVLIDKPEAKKGKTL